MARFGLLPVVLLLAATVALVVAGAEPTVASGCTIEGDRYKDLEGEGDDCHRHHVISKESLRLTRHYPTPNHAWGHNVSPQRGPAVRMPQKIHNDMPTTGSGAKNVKARQDERDNINEHGIREAFDRAAQRDLRVLKEKLDGGEISQEEYDRYKEAYEEEARAALERELEAAPGGPVELLMLYLPDPLPTPDGSVCGGAPMSTPDSQVPELPELSGTANHPQGKMPSGVACTAEVVRAPGQEISVTGYVLHEFESRGCDDANDHPGDDTPRCDYELITAKDAFASDCHYNDGEEATESDATERQLASGVTQLSATVRVPGQYAGEAIACFRSKETFNYETDGAPVEGTTSAPFVVLN